MVNNSQSSIFDDWPLAKALYRDWWSASHRYKIDDGLFNNQYWSVGLPSFAQRSSSWTVVSDYVPLVNLIGVYFQIRDDFMNLQSTEVPLSGLKNILSYSDRSVSSNSTLRIKVLRKTFRKESSPSPSYTESMRVDPTVRFSVRFQHLFLVLIWPNHVATRCSPKKANNANVENPHDQLSEERNKILRLYIVCPRQSWSTDARGNCEVGRKQRFGSYHGSAACALCLSVLTWRRSKLAAILYMERSLRLG